MPFSAVIITIGDELLIGQTIDTNSAWLAQRLNKLGIDVKRRVAIADEQNAITTTLDEYVGKVDLLLVTGGLGPTSDDITKPTLATYFGGQLVVNTTVQEHIQQIFSKRGRAVMAVNLKQAELPDNCTVLFNRMGTAAGMWFEKDKTIVISMPGVPFEMQTIFDEEATPRLTGIFQHEYIVHKTLIAVGVGESVIADKISDIEKQLPSTIHLSYLPSLGVVKLRLTAHSQEKVAIEQEVNLWAELIMQRLGNIVVADKDITLEQLIGTKLKTWRLTLSLAESCTGGMMASRITDVPGSSTYFMGSVTSYAYEVKQNILGVSAETLLIDGAVSEPCVAQMAEGVNKLLSTDLAVSISGILGPDGGTADKPVGTVWMAVTGKFGTWTQSYHFRYDRIRNKELTCNYALILLLRYLQQYEG